MNSSVQNTKKLFLWNGVMSGQYTGGVAFAIAKTRDEAKTLILEQLRIKFEGGVTQIPIDLGTWANEVDCSDPVRKAKVDLIFAKFATVFESGVKPSEETFNMLEEQKRILFFYVFKTLSEEEKKLFRQEVGLSIRDVEDPQIVKARTNKILLANLAEILDDVQPVELELDSPIAYLRGGGD